MQTKYHINTIFESGHLTRTVEINKYLEYFGNFLSIMTIKIVTRMLQIQNCTKIRQFIDISERSTDNMREGKK